MRRLGFGILVASASVVLACTPAQTTSQNGGPTDATDSTESTEATDTPPPVEDVGLPDVTPDVPPVTGDGAVGEACASGSDCAGGVCFKNGLVPNGYCTSSGCDETPCAAGQACVTFPSGAHNCVVTCQGHDDCAGLGVAQCNIDGQCWLGTPIPTESGVGGACSDDSGCVDTGAFCYPETLSDGSWTGFVHGYCLINECTPGSCPAGSVCEQIYQGGGTACVAGCTTAADCRSDEGYGCANLGGASMICWPSCGGESTCPNGYGCDAEAGECIPACNETSCPSGKVCADSGVCEDPPCTATSCPAGLACSESGVCIPDIDGGPGVGPGPACDLPERDCTGGVAHCAELIQFDPPKGPGYDDYQINGEGPTQWRSWARRDLVMLIKWATAYVDCKAKDWVGGNGHPLGLGDMSEQNGAIPGTAIGSPGHPDGTHVNGYDMDIAYFQNQPPDNKLRPVCDHVSGGKDQYHCVSEPWRLDLWRTALFLGALFDSPRTRVIGVDGKVGALSSQALLALCGNDWLPQKNCNVVKAYALAYETVDTGKGWYHFHHHHLHVSLFSVGAGKPGGGATIDGMQCITPDCSPVDYPAP